MTRVLIVEDDAQLRASLRLQLQDAGYDVLLATTVTEADERLRGPLPVNALLLDVRLGNESGVDWLETIPPDDLPVTLLMSGEATMSEAVRALKHGALDFLEKPFTRERLLRSMDVALELRGLRRQIDHLEKQGRPTILGRSEAMQRLLSRIDKAAASSSTVLLRGESGTGKELVAQALHDASPRSAGPLVRLNCAAIPSSLIEDELFGHVKGAFTGAHSAKKGLFEVADGGTLLLDEIGDMELELQGRLLRILEDGRVRRVGETQERRVDVRVLCATHRDLENSASFRQDLFFRLAQLRLEIPPLRDRPDDIRVLFEHFLEAACRDQRVRAKGASRALLEVLESHPWPGNVRELKNVCLHLAVFGDDTLTPADLPSSFHPSREEASLTHPILRLEELPGSLSLRQFKENSEREFLEIVLRRHHWNFSRAAKELRVGRTHLHDRARKLGIRRPQPRTANEPKAEPVDLSPSSETGGGDLPT